MASDFDAAALAHALAHHEDEEDEAVQSASDTVDVAELEAGDTALEHAQTAISTTMQTHKDKALATKTKGAKVKVVVREAPTSMPPSSNAPSARLGTDASERTVWTVVAVIAALLAVALGIYFGSS